MLAQLINIVDLHLVHLLSTVSNVDSAVCDISLKSVNFKLNQACLKQGVSLILGDGVEL